MPSSHHLGYMEATERRNYPYGLTLGYTPPRGTLGIFVFTPSDGCPTTANSLNLDASLAILTCVLHFEVSGVRRRTPVIPVHLTSQTSQTHQSDPPDVATSGLWPWLCGSTKEPSGFLVNHWKPRELGVASANHHS
jgi:hypothetical protein